MTKRNLVDVWITFHESDNQYTWRRKNSVIQMPRLDFLLATDVLLSIISGAEILPQYKSDYRPVQIYITIHEQEQGRGYWKFNNSLLKNEKFVKIIKEEIFKNQTAICSYTI